MMKRAGNAVDALVSVVLCLSVTRPDIISKCELLLFTACCLHRKMASL